MMFFLKKSMYFKKSCEFTFNYDKISCKNMCYFIECLKKNIYMHV